MGAPDVDLDFDDLTAMTADLGAFVTEFEDIEDSTDDVQDAVGRPQGRTTLRSRVGDFESGWDGNREVILDGAQERARPPQGHRRRVQRDRREARHPVAVAGPRAHAGRGPAMNAARRRGTHTHRNTDQGARR